MIETALISGLFGAAIATGIVLEAIVITIELGKRSARKARH